MFHKVETKHTLVVPSILVMVESFNLETNNFNSQACVSLPTLSHV